MREVVADTGPLHYLALINRIDLLPALFNRIVIPETVRHEMLHARAPSIVRIWVLDRPEWLEIVADPTAGCDDPLLADLDDGEMAAVVLAENLKASLVLIDDRAGVTAALRKGLTVTGTLGVLKLAAERGLITLEAAVKDLTATNFRYSQALIDRLLETYRKPSL